MSTPPPAGWYDDPTMVNTRRYWDGTSWTEHRQEKPPAAPAVASEPGPGEAHSMSDRIGESRPLLILLAVLVVGGILVGGWLVLSQGTAAESGSATTGDSYTSSDMATEIEDGLAEQGIKGAKITCDDFAGATSAGDQTACRGTATGVDAINIRVTFNSDGSYLWEVD